MSNLQQMLVTLLRRRGVPITEAAWESLNEYDWTRTYSVIGVGTYLGPTLITPATWAPAAGDLYVAKTGNDANAGTDPALPKLTIWSAFNSISTSNANPITIWVDAGTYDENVSASGYFLFTKAFQNFVTVRGIPGTLPIMRNVSSTFLIRPNSTCSNIRFRNIKLQSSTATSGFVFGNSALSNFEMVEVVFDDANSRTTAISLANASLSGVAIKRCVFNSDGAFNSSIATATGTRFIGNAMNQTASHSITVSGTGYVNSNIGSLTSIAIEGRTSVAATDFDAMANEVRNIVHTSGAVGFESVLDIDRNEITAPSGVRGLSVIGYTVGGGARRNIISSLGDTGLGWPIDGGTSVCDGHAIENNVITNAGTNGHALLISKGGTNATVTGNTTDATGGGSYGLVLKGTDNTVTGNTFTGGSANGMLLKDCSDCTVTGNTVNSGAGIALEFNGSSLNPTNCTVTGNTFNVTGGTLYSQLLAEIGTGNVVNENTYAISGSGAWGALLGATVNSLADVLARWAGFYDVTTNDDASTSV